MDIMKHGNHILALLETHKLYSFKLRSDLHFKTYIVIEAPRLARLSRLDSQEYLLGSHSLLLAKSNRKWETGLHQAQLLEKPEMILVKDLPVKFKESMKVSGALCMQTPWIRASTISWWSQRRLRALEHSGLKTLWRRTWWWVQLSRSFMPQIAAQWPLTRTYIRKT